MREKYAARDGTGCLSAEFVEMLIRKVCTKLYFMEMVLFLLKYDKEGNNVTEPDLRKHTKRNDGKEMLNER